MALEFKGLEPVKFGDIIATPVVSQENKMRLRSANLQTEDGANELKKILAECFPAQQMQVAAFIQQMNELDLEILQGYLIGGQRMVDLIEKEIEGAMHNE